MDVSIIMPAYNAEKYLSRALDSVLSQSFHGQMEILLSDDCSSDKTASIISSYYNQYPECIRPFYNSINLGCSANSDSLTRRAHGKYLAFCDADDLWIDSHKLEKQVRILESNPEIGMCCMVDSSLSNNNCYIKVSGIEGFYLSFASLMSSQSDIVNSSVVCRRSLFESMRQKSMWFIDHKCFFDSIWAYWFSLYSKVFCFRESIAYYRELDESDCRSRDSQKRYHLEKRYCINKMHFLMTNAVDPILFDNVLNDEYDRLYSLAKWKGELLVRKTKTFRLGRLISSPLRFTRRILKKDEQ